MRVKHNGLVHIDIVLTNSSQISLTRNNRNLNFWKNEILIESSYKKSENGNNPEVTPWSWWAFQNYDNSIIWGFHSNVFLVKSSLFDGIWQFGDRRCDHGMVSDLVIYLVLSYLCYLKNAKNGFSRIFRKFAFFIGAIKRA